jgi:lipopolysaccharide heptosyltransferase I
MSPLAARTGSSALKILILKPSSLGDVIHALPVLRLLKGHLPTSRIYWWIETGLAPLLEHDPDLDGLLYFNRKRWASPPNWVRLWQNVRWTRRQHFDWVIDLQGLARSAAFAWLASGNVTIGLDEPREGARGLYDLIAERPPFHTHAVDRYLGVLPLLGVPVKRDFQWLPTRPEVAAQVRRQWPVENSRWIALQPGARWPNKRWPVDSFAELVRQISKARSEFHFAVLGGPEDRPLGEVIHQALPQRCLNLAGETSLWQMIEWIRCSDLLITNDTGPMHVAAALDKPVVAMFGPTEPRRTGPYSDVARVLQLNLPCVPCFKSRCAYVKPLECLRALPASAVLGVVEEQLPPDRAS